MWDEQNINLRRHIGYAKSRYLILEINEGRPYLIHKLNREDILGVKNLDIWFRNKWGKTIPFLKFDLRRHIRNEINNKGHTSKNKIKLQFYKCIYYSKIISHYLQIN